MESSQPPELVIVMPVYNEQASIRKVVIEWFHEVENWTEHFVFLAINDGSTDDSLKILARLHKQLGHRLEIVSHGNRGHGQSCLEGYLIAHEKGAPWIFQIDSDGQCDPQFFFKFWRQREHHDIIYGLRTRRDDGLRRKIASWILRFFLLFLFRASCRDANVPYRLMRTSVIAPYLERIPSQINLANIALAVLLRKDAAIRHTCIPIRFRERYGGEPKVKISLFGRKAIELYCDLKKIS